MADPKVIAIGILKKRKAAIGADDDGGDEPSMPPLEEIAQELLDAIKADDAKGVAKALRGAQACMSDEPDEDDTE